MYGDYQGGQRFPNDEEKRARVPFAADSLNITLVTIDLTTARVIPEKRVGTGNFLWCIPAAPVDLTPFFNIQFGSLRNAAIPWGVGQFLRGIPFSEFYISNTAQAGKIITLMYGVQVGGFLDLQNPSSVVSSVSFTKAATFTDIADVACLTATTTLVLAANAARRWAIITSLAANTGVVRVKGVNDANLQGYELAPGQAVFLDVTSAIYVRNNSGATQNIGVESIAD